MKKVKKILTVAGAIALLVGIAMNAQYALDDYSMRNGY